MKAHEYAALDLMMGSFAARFDGYTQDSRWHRNEPLTPEVMRAAMVGGHSISGYMADARGMTHVGAIDFDLEGDQEARDVRSFLGEQGIDSLLVASRRGAHLWVITTGDGTHGQTSSVFL